MEKTLEVKRIKIDLTCIRVKMEVDESSGVNIDIDIEDEIDDDNEYEDIIYGEILCSDPHLDLYNKVVGTFKLRILFGTVENIYNTLAYSSITNLRYEEEIFKINYSDRGISYQVREEYDELMPEVFDNSFIILDRIDIVEQYRGNGILRKVINTIRRIFRNHILTKPFPLQHEGNINPENYKSDLKKVVDSYKKCGFKRVRKRSEYFVKW